MENLEETNWAWIAGIIEGEGSVGFSNGWPTLNIQMTDKDVMEKLSLYLESPLKGPLTYSTKKRSSYKPTYQIALRKTEKLYYISNKIYDYMGERRKKSINLWREYWRNRNWKKKTLQKLGNADL